MLWPHCSTVKDALTELKEILSRSQSNASPAQKLETAKILAGIEATISTIEEKSLAQGDFDEDLGLPTISGLTKPVTANHL